MSILHMSVTAGVLILGILLFRSLFLHKISKKIMVILWEIAILRLLFPVSVAVPLPDLGKYQNHRLQAWMTYETATEENTETKSTVVFEEPAALNGKSIVTIIYFSGMIFIVLGSAFLYIRDGRILKEGLPMDEDERKILTDKARLNGKELKRFSKIRLLTSDRTATPVTYGIIRPCIIFPKGISQMQERKTGFYISHELVHIKNHDNLKKLIVHIALCVHWFNPLVWVMYLFFNRDIELLCDETVIRRREESRRDYALTLLSMAEQRKIGFITGSGFGKGAVEERIVSVMKFKKSAFWGIIVSVAVVTAALTVFITNTVKYEETEAIASVEYKGTKSREDFYHDYEAIGVVYDIQNDRLLVDGKPIRQLIDEEKDMIYYVPEGEGYYQVQRNQAHQLTELIEMQESEAEALRKEIEEANQEKKALEEELERTEQELNEEIAELITAADNQEMPAEGTGVEEEGFSARLKEEVEKLVSKYKDYGLTAEFTKDDYQLYYNGEPVCWFADNQNGANAEEFKGSFFSRPASEKNGYGAVVTKRDENGKLEGLVCLTKEEAEDYMNGNW